MKKPFWFVCSNGVIWPVYQEGKQWKTPYPCHDIAIAQGSEYEIVQILASDNSVTDEFVLWDSLSNLVSEITQSNGN